MPYDLQLGIAGAIDSGLGRVLGGNAVQQLQNLRQAQAQQEEYQAGKARAENMHNVLSRVRDPEQLKSAAWDMMQSGDEAGAMQLLEAYKNLTARPAASSTIGQIQADIDAKLIDPATGAAALKKATTIAPVYDPVSGNMIYAGDGGFVQPSGGGMGAPMDGEGMSDIPPGMNPKEAQSYREGRASKLGATDAELNKQYKTISTRLPSLIDKVEKASELAQKATYTLGGEATDYVMNRVFGKETEGGTAKVEYETKILNEVLPTLSEIFPGAVTEGEREALVKMMGNSEMTPMQKNAALKSYVEQKLSSVRAIGSQLGKDTEWLAPLETRISRIGAPAVKIPKAAQEMGVTAAEYDAMTPEERALFE